MSELHTTDVETFIRNVGIKNADRVLKVLSKHVAIYEAMNAPLGQILMKEVMDNIDQLLEKIIEEKASDQDKADFRAYKRIAESWANKILAYKEGITQIKETNNKGGKI